jgi:hypothetical protein
MWQEGMQRGSPVVTLALVSTLAIATIGSAGGAAASTSPSHFAPTNVNVSQLHGNQSEPAIAVNPLDPNNVVVVSNVDNLSAGCSKA